MQVRTVETDTKVKDNIGKYAIERGPLVYCMEEIDNPQGFAKTESSQSFTVEWRPDLLGGVNVIRQHIQNWNNVLIPYYAWANRGFGKMKVWKNKE